jgi:hypothetical protein
MCGNRSWHTYAMHSVLPLKPGRPNAPSAIELGKRRGSDTEGGGAGGAALRVGERRGTVTF